MTASVDLVISVLQKIKYQMDQLQSDLATSNGRVEVYRNRASELELKQHETSKELQIRDEKIDRLNKRISSLEDDLALVEALYNQVTKPGAGAVEVPAKDKPKPSHERNVSVEWGARVDAALKLRQEKEAKATESIDLSLGPSL